MKYKTIHLTSKQAYKLREKWGNNGPHYCESNYGNCYWNRETGEILWISDDDCGSNACVLNENS